MYYSLAVTSVHRAHFHFVQMRPEGFEPPKTASKAAVISISPWAQNNTGTRDKRTRKYGESQCRSTPTSAYPACARGRYLR